MPILKFLIGGARPTLSLWLLMGLLAVLWIAGGASHPDVVGQAVVRLVSWLLLLGAVVFWKPLDQRDHGAVALFLIAILTVVLLQLVPLPPVLWLSLPGREIFSEVARIGGSEQPWRPLSITPDATINAASSLIIPIATFIFAAGLTRSERLLSPGLVFVLIAASAFVGLLQFSGGDFNNRLINDVGQVSGFFANRNHFALFMAMGCLIAPYWAFQDGGRPQLRGPIALALVLLFALIILGSGSRAGLILGPLGLVLGIAIVWKRLARTFRLAPKWVLPAILIGAVVVIGAVISISFAADRAVAIGRVLTLSTEDDMRSRALPTIWTMIKIYFPAGSGIGTFDPVYRIHQPMDLLTVYYLNHAHNDFLEIILDAGLAGLILLALALGWWVFASLRAWRAELNSEVMLARLGSSILFLVFIGSLFDYPARTPMIMAVIILASLWLSWGTSISARSALPRRVKSI